MIITFGWKHGNIRVELINGPVQTKLVNVFYVIQN